MKRIIISLCLLLNFSLHADEMEMTDTNGTSYKVLAQEDEFKIEGMEGKVVFLEFFGLNCPACKELMPNLIALQKQYPNRLKVMAIEVQNHEIDPIEKYKAAHGINYTTFSNYDVGFVVRYIANKAQWKGAIPFLVAIDSKGKVQALKVGITPKEELQSYVESYSK